MGFCENRYSQGTEPWSSSIDPSFSAEFAVISKLVIIAMRIRVRYRSLPYALDRAILLPSKNLQKKDTKDTDRYCNRRGSTFAEGYEANSVRQSAWKMASWMIMDYQNSIWVSWVVCQMPRWQLVPEASARQSK